MNKIIHKNQCNIIYHVDYLKTSHVYPTVIYSVLSDIDAEYGKIAKITITWGRVHKYLVMSKDYSSPGNLILSMIDYIEKMLDNILEDIKVESETPAAHHLF